MTTTPLVKLSAANRHVWFLSSDGEKIDKIKKNQKIYELASGSGGATKLSDLTDVEIETPQDNCVLQYSATAQKGQQTGLWKANVLTIPTYIGSSTIGIYSDNSISVTVSTETGNTLTTKNDGLYSSSFILAGLPVQLNDNFGACSKLFVTVDEQENLYWTNEEDVIADHLRASGVGDDDKLYISLGDVAVGDVLVVNTYEGDLFLANKPLVTSFSFESPIQSEDYQVPSAKAVYDALAALDARLQALGG